MMVAMRIPMFLAAFSLAAPALADPQVYRLSPAERAAAIESGARRGETSALIPAPLDPGPLTSHLPAGSLYGDDETRADRRAHGEFGIVAGTGGTLGFYGSAVVPLSDNATLGLSFAYGQGRGFGGYGGGFGGYDGFGYSGFGGYGIYPGYVSPGFPWQLVPGPGGRRPAR
ncbi:hypothetical protein IP88_00705 [alpha proteobacterium AAP81b]|nr:hypothetical protein IP88_00705 [alpha proteobacterium AAP81b]